MYVPGGSKILLDSEPPAQTNPRPASVRAKRVVWADSLESASSWISRDSSWHGSCHIRMKGVDQ
jgi:hypothetical protein